MKKFVLLAALLVFAAVPALALAKKIQTSGGVIGDKNSRVSLRVTVKGGDIKKISGFKAKGINIRCDGKSTELDFNITGSVKTNAKDNFKARIPNTTNPKEKLRVSGRVQNKGKKVVGNIKTNKITLSGMNCDMPKQRFVAKK